MAIIQVSKILHRTGANVDLPQLDEGEVGFATDERKVFIGNDPILHPPQDGETTTQTELLTEVSTLNFAKIEGADNSTLNITELTDGQLLVADGHTWVNAGGNSNININLGDAEYVALGGGQNGYVLQTDGLGKLSWASSGIVTYNISGVSKANPAVVTTTEDNSIVTGIPVTITGVLGMTQLATAGEYSKNKFYPVKINESSFALYKDSLLTQAVDSTGFTTATSSSGLVTASFYAAGTGSPGGSNNQIQINDGAGGFLGSPNLSFNRLSSVLTLNGNIVAGTVNANLRGALTGSVGTITPNSGAFTSITATTTANITGNISTSANINVTRNLVVSANSTTANLRVSNTANVQNLNVSGNVTSSLIPNSNVTYSLGNNTNRWNDLYLSGSTIYLADQQISATSDGISFGNNGKLTVANANLGNTATANYFAGLVNTPSQPNITSLGTLTTLNVAGPINLGNVANLKIQGGSPNYVLTLQPDGSNITWRETQFKKTPPGGSTSQIQFNDQNDFGGSSLFTFNSGSGIVTATGFIGNGDSLANLTGANVTGQVSNALVAGTVYTSEQPNITSIGTLGNLSVTNNVSVGLDITAGANLSVDGRATIAGNISASNGTLGNAVTANFFIGSGNNLSDIQSANITGIVANSNYAAYVGDVVNASQPNITSVGVLTSLIVSSTVNAGNTSLGNLDVFGFANVIEINVTNRVLATGDIVGANIRSNGWLYANSGNIVGNNINSFNDVVAGANVLANAVTANIITSNGNIFGSNITASGILSVTGTITSGSQTIAGAVTATSTVTGGNLTTTGLLTVGSNANVGNLGTTGLVTATGNITGGNLITGGVASIAGNANVGNLGTTGLITATGNITGANIIGIIAAGSNTITTTGNANVGNLGTSGLITATGNIIGGNLITGGRITVAGTASITGTANVGSLETYGNITGGNLITSGVANIAGNANVGNLGTTGLITATGNITGANIITNGRLSVTGNANVGNLGTTAIIATDDITTSADIYAANYYWSNGVLFQSYGNANVGAYLTGYAGNLAANNFITVGNITSIANISAANISTGGILIVTGNASAGNISASIGAFSGNVSAANLSSGDLISGSRITVSGNASVGNLSVAGGFSVNGNITGANLNTGGSAIIAGDVSANNVSLAGNISAVGNLSAGNLTSSNLVSGITLSFSGNANVGPLRSTGNVTALGNISAGNISTTGTIQATGNATVGNVSATNGDFSGRLTAGSFGLLGTISPSRGNTISSGLVWSQYPSYDSARVARINYYSPSGTTDTILEINNQNTAGDNVYITASGTIVANNSTDATSSTTAGLITTGGVGIAKSLIVGANITANNANLGNLVRANNFTGKITNGSSNIDVTSSSTVNISAAGVANVMSITSTDVNVLSNVNAPNITATTMLTAVASYVSGNATVAGKLDVTGNVNAGNLNTAGGFTSAKTITAGNLATAGTLTAGDTTVTGNLSLSGNANVGNLGTTGLITATGNITGGNLSTAGTLTAGDTTITGNLVITGSTIYANIASLNVKDPIIEQGGNPTGALSSNDGKDRGQLLHYYRGSAIDAFMGWKNSSNEFVFSSNASVTDNLVTINELGNIRAGNAQLGNLASATYFSGTLTTAAQPNITSIGTLSTLGVTGNITSGNANLGNLVSANYLAGVLTTASQPNITSVGTLISLAVTGNVTSGNVYANSGTIGASLLTGTLTTASQPNITSVGSLTSLTVLGSANVGSANITANLTSGNANLGNLVTANYFAGILTTAGQPNITTVGTLISLGVTGNITSGNANLGNLVSSNYFAGILTTASQPNITSIGTLTSLGVTGNITSGNISTGIVAASGNITGSSNLSITGNISSGNISTGIVAASGNITGANLITNGKLSVTGNANLGNLGTTAIIATGNISASGTLSITGNASTGNLFVTGSLSTTGNSSAGNLSTVGKLDVTGNANIGNVSTGILTTSSNVTIGNVLSVTGKSYLGNDTEITGYLSADGDITGRNLVSIGNLSVAETANVTGNINSSGNINVDKKLSAGNIYSSGSLNILGDGFMNALTAYGLISTSTAISAGTNLSVGANATITGKLNVTGNSSVSNISASGTANVTGNITGGNISSLNNANVANIANVGNLSIINYALSNVIPDANVTYYLGNNTNRWRSLALSNSGISIGSVELTSTGANLIASGNITAGNNITATDTFYGVNVSVTGNITATNANLGNLVTANYYTGTLTTNAQPNVTSVGVLTGLTIGNATANTVFGNGTITTTGNVSVGAFLSVTNNVTVSGNLNTTGLVSAGRFNTGGSIVALGDITGANLIATTGFQAANLTAGQELKAFGNANIVGNIFGNNITSNNVISTANLTVSNTISSTKQLTGNNATIANLTISTSANIGAPSKLIITGGSLGYVLQTDGSGNLSWATPNAASGSNTYVQFNDSGILGSENEFAYNKDTGNLTAPYFVGDGSLLTSLNPASLSGAVASATTATTAGTVTNATQSNITSVGTLTSLTVSGNITSTGRLIVNGKANISSIGNVYLPGGTSGDVIKTDGTGNLAWYTIPVVSPGGNDSYIQFNDGGVFTGNSAFTFTKATGKVTATSFSGDGSALSNITAGNIVGTVASATSAGTSVNSTSAVTAGTVTTASQPNITTVGTLKQLALSNAGYTESDRITMTGLYGARTGLYAGTGYTTSGTDVVDMYSAILTKPNESGTGVYISDMQSQFSFVVDNRISHIFDSTGAIRPGLGNRVQNLGSKSGGVSTIKVITGTPVGTIGFNTYNNVSSTTNGSGTGATFDVYTQTRLAPYSGQEYRIRVRNMGSGYAATNTITIAGTSLGGATPTNDVTFTVAAITGDRYWKNAFVGDVVLNNGTGNWTLMAGSDGLYLYNNATGSKYLISMTLVASGGPNPLGQ